MRILAISGSLRRESSNTNLLRAAERLAPAGMTISLYDGLGELPPFNPDHEGQGDDPLSVQAFRAHITAADALLISTPEYAHGLPGVLKNALDWLVGSGELMEKPVGLLNASPHSVFAQAQLIETLTVMMARVLPEATVTIERLDRSLPPAEMVASPEIAAPVLRCLSALAHAIENSARPPSIHS